MAEKTSVSFTRTFAVNIASVNDAPTLSHIANQTINENGATAALPFTVSDVETPAGNLSVSGSSSNPSLVPPGNIVFVSVDKGSGTATESEAPGSINEAFIAGTQPGSIRQ